jgi:hypothetical protein
VRDRAAVRIEHYRVSYDVTDPERALGRADLVHELPRSSIGWSRT